jgi:hypothetical protein
MSTLAANPYSDAREYSPASIEACSSSIAAPHEFFDHTPFDVVVISRTGGSVRFVPVRVFAQTGNVRSEVFIAETQPDQICHLPWGERAHVASVEP